MHRRAAITLIAASVTTLANAQRNTTRFQPGKQYDILDPAQPTTSGQNKVEVVEFFWYACPHCSDLEPYLQRWTSTKPNYVTLVHVPVAWDQPARLAHAKLYFSLVKLGREDLHQAVYNTIHREKNFLYDPSDAITLQKQSEWCAAHGINAEEFEREYRAPERLQQIERANALAQGYRVVGVPSIGIAGKYTTDVGKAGGTSNLFALIDELVTNTHG